MNERALQGLPANRYRSGEIMTRHRALRAFIFTLRTYSLCTAERWNVSRE